MCPRLPDGISHNTVRGSEPSWTLLKEVGVEGTYTPVARPVISIMRKEEMMFCGFGHKTVVLSEPWDFLVAHNIFLIYSWYLYETPLKKKNFQQ